MTGRETEISNGARRVESELFRPTKPQKKPNNRYHGREGQQVLCKHHTLKKRAEKLQHRLQNKRSERNIKAGIIKWLVRHKAWKSRSQAKLRQKPSPKRRKSRKKKPRKTKKKRKKEQKWNDTFPRNLVMRPKKTDQKTQSFDDDSFDLGLPKKKIEGYLYADKHRTGHFISQDRAQPSLVWAIMQEVFTLQTSGQSFLTNILENLKNNRGFPDLSWRKLDEIMDKLVAKGMIEKFITMEKENTYARFVCA